MENNSIYLKDETEVHPLMKSVCEKADKMISDAYANYVNEAMAKGFTELESIHFVPLNALGGLCASLNIAYDKLRFYKEFDKTFAVYNKYAMESPFKNLRSTVLFVVYNNADVYNAMLRGKTAKWFEEQSSLLLKTVNDFGTYYEQHSEDSDALCLFEAATIAQFRKAYKITFSLSDPLPEERFDALIKNMATAYISNVPKERRKTLDMGWGDLDSGSCWFNDSYYFATMRVQVDGVAAPLTMKCQDSRDEVFKYESLPIFIYGTKVYDFENRYIGVDFKEYMKIVVAANPDVWFDQMLCYGKIWDEDVSRCVFGITRLITNK